jgi:hypothetical protein
MKKHFNAVANYHIKLSVCALALCLLMATTAYADNLHVLVYVDGETPATTADGTTVHWKSIVPKLNGDVIQNFVVLATQGSKRLFYCLLDTDDPQFARVRDWVQANKATLGLKWWVGRSAREVWKEVFKDRTTDTVASTIINNLIKYPVTVVDGDTGKNVTKYVPIKDLASYGATVNWSYYLTANLDAILPHKFFDGSK